MRRRGSQGRSTSWVERSVGGEQQATVSERDERGEIRGQGEDLGRRFGRGEPVGQGRPRSNCPGTAHRRSLSRRNLRSTSSARETARAGCLERVSRRAAISWPSSSGASARCSASSAAAVLAIVVRGIGRSNRGLTYQEATLSPELLAPRRRCERQTPTVPRLAISASKPRAGRSP